MAFAAALRTFYERRGFVLENKKVLLVARLHIYSTDYALQGELIQDPFRRSLATASQWFDALRKLVNSDVDSAIRSADQSINTFHSKCDAETEQLRTECLWILQNCCPACFGGSHFGRPFKECVAHAANQLYYPY